MDTEHGWDGMGCSPGERARKTMRLHDVYCLLNVGRGKRADALARAVNGWGTTLGLPFSNS